MRIGKLIAVAGIIFSTTLSSPAATTNKVVAAKNYTEQQVQAFNQQAERQFHKLSKELDDLKAQSQKQTGDAKAALDKKVAEAQKRIDDLKPKLAELKTATTNVWSDIKSGFEKGLDDLRNALK